MPAEPLTPERILQATEEVLRRHGPAKATVVDVARALGVSHGSVYRHFRTKAALRDAVVSRWLERVTAPLIAIAEEDGPADERLDRWLATLFAAKREKVEGDPELFATYHALIDETGGAVDHHFTGLVDQLTGILEAGVAQGRFHSADPAADARAVFDATSRFHDPYYAAEWSEPGIDAAFEAVRRLVARGLRGA